MLHFIQYSMQNDEVAQHILFEYIDLIEYHIRVQHQIMRKWIVRIQRSRSGRQYSIVLFVLTHNAYRRTAPNILAQIMLANNLQIYPESTLAQAVVTFLNLNVQIH